MGVAIRKSEQQEYASGVDLSQVPRDLRPPVISAAKAAHIPILCPVPEFIVITNNMRVHRREVGVHELQALTRRSCDSVSLACKKWAWSRCRKKGSI